VDPTRCIIRNHDPAGHGDIRLGFWAIKHFGWKRFLEAFGIPPGDRGSPSATAVIEWRRPTSLHCVGKFRCWIMRRRSLWCIARGLAVCCRTLDN